MGIPINAYGIRCPYCGAFKFAYQFEIRSRTGEYTPLGNDYGYADAYFNRKVARCPECRNEMPAELLALGFYGDTAKYRRIAYIGISDFSNLRAENRVWFDENKRLKVVFVALAGGISESLRDKTLQTFARFDDFELYAAVKPNTRSEGIEAATALAYKLSEALLGTEPKQKRLYLCYKGDMERDIKSMEHSIMDYRYWKEFLGISARYNHCFNTSYRVNRFDGPEIPAKRVKKLIKYIDNRINKISG